MALSTGSNSTSPNSIKWAGADSDPYDRATQMAGPVQNFDVHDHSSGKCLPVARVSATSCKPASDDGAALGDATALRWSDLFLALGGVINFNDGDVTLTHSSNLLTIAGGNVIISSPGSASGSVTTIDGTQTLTNKTLTTPTISSTGFTNATHAHAAANSGGTLGLGTASGGVRGSIASAATTVIYNAGTGDGAVHAYLLTTKKTVAGVDVQWRFGTVMEGSNGYLEWNQIQGGGGTQTTVSIVSNTQLQLADGGGGVTTEYSLVKLF